MKQRDSLIDRLTGGATTQDGDPRAAQFVRGLALGALVGAAIAGSAIWQRRQTRSTTPDPGPAGDDSRASPGPEST